MALKPILVGTLYLSCVSLESSHQVVSTKIPNHGPKLLHSQVGLSRIMMEIDLCL